MLSAGTKGVDGMVWVNRAVRGVGWCVVGWYQGCRWCCVGTQNGEGGGWCVVGWYQGCEWYGVGKQSGEGWLVVCCRLVPRV